MHAVIRHTSQEPVGLLLDFGNRRLDDERLHALASERRRQLVKDALLLRRPRQGLPALLTPLGDGVQSGEVGLRRASSCSNRPRRASISAAAASAAFVRFRTSGSAATSGPSAFSSSRRPSSSAARPCSAVSACSNLSTTPAAGARLPATPGASPRRAATTGTPPRAASSAAASKSNSAMRAATCSRRPASSNAALSRRFAACSTWARRSGRARSAPPPRPT